MPALSAFQVRFPQATFGTQGRERERAKGLHSVTGTTVPSSLLAPHKSHVTQLRSLSSPLARVSTKLEVVITGFCFSRRARALASATVPTADADASPSPVVAGGGVGPGITHTSPSLQSGFIRPPVPCFFPEVVRRPPKPPNAVIRAVKPSSSRRLPVPLLRLSSSRGGVNPHPASNRGGMP